MSDTSQESVAILGGGCFWCLEAIFQRKPGVSKVVSGYAGGGLANPTYKEVCGGGTGHAEVVAISFDPAQVSFSELLELFWLAHDPTTKDRQGGDAGPQYRSIILASDDEQLNTAEQSKAAAQPSFKAPIVTEIAKLTQFWPAEVEHHDYYNRNRLAPYCIFAIVPKLKKLGM